MSCMIVVGIRTTYFWVSLKTMSPVILKHLNSHCIIRYNDDSYYYYARVHTQTPRSNIIVYTNVRIIVCVLSQILGRECLQNSRRKQIFPGHHYPGQIFFGNYYNYIYRSAFSCQIWLVTSIYNLLMPPGKSLPQPSGPTVTLSVRFVHGYFLMKSNFYFQYI